MSPSITPAALISLSSRSRDHLVDELGFRVALFRLDQLFGDLLYFGSVAFGEIVVFCGFALKIAR
jgi:hypothetical protein